MQRHFAESESDELIYQPGIDFRQWVKGEFIARWKNSWQAPVTTVGWERAWIVETDARIIGHADLKSPKLSSSLHRAVFAIGLEREARGQGFGRDLSALALEWARDERLIEWVDLYVFSHNRRARALYRALGFTEVATVRDRFRVNGERIDDIHMTLRLQPAERSLHASI